MLHSLEQTAKWRADGILDTVAASAVVEQLGVATFEQGVLDVLRGSDGLIAAVPTDARQHLIVYRSDWFEQAGLAPPTSFAAMLLGAATFFEEEGLTSGIVVPTESSWPARSVFLSISPSPTAVGSSMRKARSFPSIRRVSAPILPRLDQSI